ncbi:EPIDERMAL PATTERNING FACTOR-like protein 2 [Prosopis cineraria]|uniref:EPIDERMAL PATTERNING FACTOR-like protein 2 n=1 Tax=Prosopis cineraria TaxID=364024 RepID=UPI00240EC9E0|nr:EPIDERMAL PATTERNING FACTOR-like protein 2 [Prosopis cineraria]
MEHDNHVICGHRLSLISISFLFLIISSWIQQGSVTEGREGVKKTGFSQAGEDKSTVRAQIGSRPPRCERRCSWCGHCEAVQVPTNPQMQNAKRKSSTVSTVASVKGDDYSNYKPMSWKCKCGNLILNP